MNNMTTPKLSDKSAKTALSMRVVREAHNTLDTTLLNVNASLDGLTVADASARYSQNGPNEVAHDRPPHILIQLAIAFKNPFIAVLVVLAIIQFFTDFWIPYQTGDETDLTGVTIVLTMVLISGFLRFWQEYRSNKAAETLKAMVRTTATVFRRNNNSSEPQRLEIPITELVTGDVVHLSAGDMVPADIRLIESRDLFVSQAVLTGEALPVEKYDTMGNITEKHADTVAGDQADLLDLPNVCFMGTNVVSGTAKALVIATGASTYFGSLAKSVVGTRAQTAFDRGVNSVSWLLIRFMVIMVPIVFLINGVGKGDWVEAFLFAVAVAVGLTPEMLPLIVSSNLAKGAVLMAKRKVVVKRLNAIQNFGAMNILCTDKTGTLTQDRIILEHHVNLQKQDDKRVFELAWLNSFHQSGMRNLMDQAVVHFGEKFNQNTAMRAFRKIDEIPFDFMRRRLSIVLENTQEEHLLVCKGAVEEMLSVATKCRDGDKIRDIDAKLHDKIAAIAEAYNEDGFRVLLVASRVLDQEEKSERYNTSIEKDLIIEGFLTFLDPPKETARPAIAALRENGVAVKVLTGDNAIVTTKVCREVGLEPGVPLIGRDIEAMSDDMLRAEVEDRRVFAKLTPLQKSRVLKALQANGYTVGFLGDGINDAPALRDADVGISVDSGADIAKESADIILLEKSLMILEEGVIRGRETFGNIVKYLNMTASSNFGNVFSVLVASAFIPFLPMLSIQLLLQNLLYDISQLSLPWDKMDKEFLAQPRKWSARNIGRLMVFFGPISSIFDMTTFVLLWYVFGANSDATQSLFQSGWFVEGLLSQTLVVHMLRTQKIPFIQSTAALPVLLLTGSIMVIGVVLPFTSIGTTVGLVPLPWSYFPWLVLTLFAYCCLAQAMKIFYIRIFKQWF